MINVSVGDIIEWDDDNDINKGYEFCSVKLGQWPWIVIEMHPDAYVPDTILTKHPKAMIISFMCADGNVITGWSSARFKRSFDE